MLLLLIENERILKFRSEILSHGMQQQCSLTPSSIYLIPLSTCTFFREALNIMNHCGIYAFCDLHLTSPFERRPRRKLFIVPITPSCEIWNASLRTLVRFNSSRWTWETSILAKIASLSSWIVKWYFSDNEMKMSPKINLANYSRIRKHAYR